MIQCTMLSWRLALCAECKGKLQKELSAKLHLPSLVVPTRQGGVAQGSGCNKRKVARQPARQCGVSQK